MSKKNNWSLENKLDNLKADLYMMAGSSVVGTITGAWCLEELSKGKTGLAIVFGAITTGFFRYSFKYGKRIYTDYQQAIYRRDLDTGHQKTLGEK